ncbi:hypothetical protein FOVG_01801 [Fusarium oxysporum f. sp. pisi HDV247]|uniref:BTB domain-containing protein n=1 Tax=Fusarium oxysporum f. sp. pisi HDV247 TaxID=1080344 RepID=W9QIX2_FUSOX|nr:hypothetical protein FOVG_01801 [Fusarium oxysporum f. sp. pisi HDV247]EXA54302.1 hypothetical protein FOVG_01801 [Fusarium oxysporum f. sp. pisi HDV247]EXA54303.1 hypothetical protein FOVG_01801 [Fusarium oxysporum f. sp. pisi HDV247]EXA54304.1 hypothetical protein FOVG_01801 [Fusarium oxysporum f. sp. pisi HDV247]
MFSSSRRHESSSKSFSKSHKASKSSSSFSKDSGITKRRHESRHRRPTMTSMTSASGDTMMDNNMASPIVTLVVGSEQRLFAAHEDVLATSPFFNNALRNGYMDVASKRISLPDEEPEIFSSVLEFLYKGDYTPRLVHNKRRNSYELEAASEEQRAAVESTVYHRGIDGDLLKDTVIYCAAEKYGLDELKKLSLRKQGLRRFQSLPFQPFTDGLFSF